MQERGILNFLIRNAAGQQGVKTPVGIAKIVSPPAVLRAVEKQTWNLIKTVHCINQFRISDSNEPLRI